jgi:hypothetical protein
MQPAGIEGRLHAGAKERQQYVSEGLGNGTLLARADCCVFQSMR